MAATSDSNISAETERGTLAAFDIPLPTTRNSSNSSYLQILAHVSLLTTTDLILVRSPSSKSGNWWYRWSQMTKPNMASPRNSKRSFEASR